MHLNRPARQAGFTLVEVLVTIFVVAIGLLSATALQAISKKAAVEAMQRTTATVLAQDMLERIRSNSAQEATYVGRTVSAANVPTQPACGRGTACSAAELVDVDYYEWWRGLDGASEQITNGADAAASAGGLRSPIGCVRREGAVSGVGGWVEVIIEWRGLSVIDQTDDGNPDDPTSATCGATADDFGKTGNQSFRRVLRLQAHVRT